MPLAPSGHDLRGWSKPADEEREPSDLSADRTPLSTPNKANHPLRSAVPMLDRLLMAALLLIVAGWIVFRLVMPLVTLG